MINIRNVIEMQINDYKNVSQMQMNEKVASSSCGKCYYFFNCQTEGIQDNVHEFCLTNPEALGYCELWGGALKNCEACHGFTPKKK